MHLIRFPNKKEHKRGLMAILQVPRLESLGLPGLQMVVEDEHIAALEREKISFTDLSKTTKEDARSSLKRSANQAIAAVRPQLGPARWFTNWFGDLWN